MHSPSQTNTDKIDAINRQLQQITKLLENDRMSPVVSLEEAADHIFKKSPATILRWIKNGHLRACKIPDGNRGHHYYFVRDQLMEDLEHNFET